MSEFKGTKGKWEVDRYNNVTTGYSEIAFLKSATKNHERRYNALLISKAPEMLEMLKEVLAGRIRPREYQSEWDMVNELIKSATEG